MKKRTKTNSVIALIVVIFIGSLIVYSLFTTAEAQTSTEDGGQQHEWVITVIPLNSEPNDINISLLKQTDEELEFEGERYTIKKTDGKMIMTARKVTIQVSSMDGLPGHYKGSLTEPGNSMEVVLEKISNLCYEGTVKSTRAYVYRKDASCAP